MVARCDGHAELTRARPVQQNSDTQSAEFDRFLGFPREVSPRYCACWCGRRSAPSQIATLRKRFVLTKKLFLAVITFLFVAALLAPAQTLTTLTHQPPDGAGIGFLLTDGTAVFQGNGLSDWWKLTPDINGSYVHGTWSQIASLPSGYEPDAFASAVLADGRLLIEGGEYNFNNFVLTNLGAVYDPRANTWTPLTPPPGWDYIGDSPSVVLPNGHFLIGRKLDMQVAELDPATMTWTLLGSSGKSDFNAEEGWTLMPGGTVLTVDVLDNPNSERYIPSMQQWISDGNTVANLQGPPEEGCLHYGGGLYCPPGEIGPAILRPDGTVFATGAHHTRAPVPGTPRSIITEPALPIRVPGSPVRTSPMAMTRATTSPRCCPTGRYWCRATRVDCTNSMGRTSVPHCSAILAVCWCCLRAR